MDKMIMQILLKKHLKKCGSCFLRQ